MAAALAEGANLFLQGGGVGHEPGRRRTARAMSMPSMPAAPARNCAHRRRVCEARRRYFPGCRATAARGCDWRPIRLSNSRGGGSVGVDGCSCSCGGWHVADLAVRAGRECRRSCRDVRARRAFLVMQLDRAADFLVGRQHGISFGFLGARQTDGERRQTSHCTDATTGASSRTTGRRMRRRRARSGRCARSPASWAALRRTPG